MSWHRRLLEDAQAVTAAEEAEEAKKRKDELANEFADACNVLGRELSRLTGFVQWADAVVSAAETTSRPERPERYYIGDGIVAQLLADAESVARAAW